MDIKQNRLKLQPLEVKSSHPRYTDLQGETITRNFHRTYLTKLSANLSVQIIPQVHR